MTRRYQPVEACRYAPDEPWRTAEETEALIAACRATDALATRASIAIALFGAIWIALGCLA